jgi:four helix bundle protein
MRNFEDLRVWQAAHQLTLDVYKAVKLFPADERYELRSQVIRAVVSIEANIAEGCGRRTDAELHRFLQISMGSLSELKCELRIAKDLAYIQPAQSEALANACSEVGRMLNGLSSKLVPPSKQRATAAASS